MFPSMVSRNNKPHCSLENVFFISPSARNDKTNKQEAKIEMTGYFFILDYVFSFMHFESLPPGWKCLSFLPYQMMAAAASADWLIAVNSNADTFALGCHAPDLLGLARWE